MDDQPNLREFLNEVSSFTEEPKRQRRLAPGAIAGCHRQGRRNRRLGLADAHGRRDAGRAAVEQRPVGGDVGPGRQPGQDGGRQQLADRQRPHPQGRRQRRARRHMSTSSAKASAIPTGELSNFRRGVTRYPIPGLRSACRSRPRTCARSSPPATSRISKSAPSIRPTTSAARSTSTRCCRSISRSWARPVPANRPRSR